MAEVVELRLEKMLPELEQMERVQLFKPKEIKKILKKRKQMEYRTQRRTKCKEDYLHYIQFESNLLALIRIRRRRIGYKFKKREIDNAIATRIHRMFTKVTCLFPADIRLRLSHIDFCKEMAWNSWVSRLLVKLVQNHGHKEHLWILAAKWEFEHNMSTENARKLLLRALRAHPSSAEIYLQAFRLELLHIERLFKRMKVLGIERSVDEVVDDPTLSGKLAEVFFKHAVTTIPNPAHLLRMIGEVSSADIGPLQSSMKTRMITMLQESFPHHALTWDTRARIELDKIFVENPEKDPENEEKVEKESDCLDFISIDGKASKNQPSLRKVKLRERIDNSCQVYEAALVEVPTAEMWGYYLTTLQELLQSSVKLNTFIQDKYLDVLQRGNESKMLQEEHYVHWLTIVDAKEALTISEKATELYPKNCQLWFARIKSMCDLEEPDLDSMVLALRTLSGYLEKSDDIVNMWRCVWSWTHMKCPKKVEKLFIVGLEVNDNLARELKSDYLGWIAAEKGFESAWSFYQQQYLQPPFSLQFHLTMADLCNDVDKSRKCYQNAANFFGKEYSEIWLRWISFEQQSGNSLSVSSIHWKACHILNRELVDEFVMLFEKGKFEQDSVNKLRSTKKRKLLKLN